MAIKHQVECAGIENSVRHELRISVGTSLSTHAVAIPEYKQYRVFLAYAVRGRK